MEIEGLNKISKECYNRAVELGFYNTHSSLNDIVMHAVSELSEFSQAVRHNKETRLDKFEDSKQKLSNKLMPIEAFRESFQMWVKDTDDSELTDALQVILGLCGSRGIDIEKHLQLKDQYNEIRNNF